MSSPRFRELIRRASELRRNLLPRAFSPTGTYKARELDRARGYRLLIHAEVEAFLEDRVRQTANDAIAKWLVDRRLRSCLMSLLAFYLEQEIVSHKQLKDEYAGTNQRLDEALESACDAFNKSVGQNNGVRERNVLRLLFPVGLKRNEIDPTWLSTIDSFGTRRGEVAHSSVQTQQPPDPKNELDTVKLILKGLADIDRVLQRIGR